MSYIRILTARARRLGRLAALATLAHLALAGQARADESCSQKARHVAAMAMARGASSEAAEVIASEFQSRCIATQTAQKPRKQAVVPAIPMPRPGREPAPAYNCKCKVVSL